MEWYKGLKLAFSMRAILEISVITYLALAGTLKADNFVITESDNSTNGIGTTNDATAAPIGADAINGSDRVFLGIDLTTTGNNIGIKTSNNGSDIDGNTIIVSGNLSTTGTGAGGIYNYGDKNETTLSSTVKAKGSSSAALYNVSGSGNSFTLDEGATIIGEILAGVTSSNSKLIFNLSASTSYAYSVSGKGSGTGAGQWTFSDLDGRTQVVTTTGTGCDTTIAGAGNDTCNLVTAVVAANAEVQNELQYITSTSLINSLRLDTPVNTSQDKTTATDVWFDAYGVSTERDASTWDTTGVLFNADTRGVTIGQPLVLGDSFGLDLVFNSSQTDLNVGATKHQNIAAKSFNFGVVMTDLASSSNWDVDVFGFIGGNSYYGKRKVMNNQVSTGMRQSHRLTLGQKHWLGLM